ncbi:MULTISPECIES: SDR family NAD(P)-dependent oxidoreductase [unclassified Nocardia]|uniref:SDR family NAD(P)-dependent oxidoreductase n=1 Tax=unclassified Nocardia TaxID=2637762 RepID=UPI001CE470B0|nr:MULTISPECIES: SDR family NAD(P)-dependent oxidoreductase [unclassified Nocardia]
MKLEAGQVAVITGAANGIGQALAGALHARGLRVVLADIEEDSVRRAAAELGGETLAVPTDVADPAQVQRLAEATVERFGRVDLVANNAGVGAGGAMWSIEPEDWQRVWSVNVGGVVNGIRAFVPHLIASGHGHVVNTASIAGVSFGAFNAPYTASKHAVISLSESLRGELDILAPEIGVTVMCPGPVDTRMLRGVTDGASAEARTEWLASFTPEQWERFAPRMEIIKRMQEEMMPAAEAAEIIIRAVETNRLYVTTHPHYAEAAKSRAELVVAGLAEAD